MSKKRFSIYAILMTVLVTFLLTGGLGILVARSLIGPSGLSMLQSLHLLETRYVADYDEEAAVDAALSAMVASLDDRWSLYLDPAWHAAYEQSSKNAYVGIGVTYQRSEDPVGMELMEVTDGGPAQAAGLVVGDIITALNGEPFTEDNFNDLVSQVRAEEGAVLEFTVQGADGSARPVSVTLSQIVNSPVEYELLEGNVGYIKVDNFHERAAADAQAAVEELMEQGAEGLLFDVRGNPGGYVSEVTKLLDYLLPEGPLLIQKTRSGREYVYESDAACVDLPMVVLMDGDSYSAAEIFAAQMRESIGAPLVGQKTFGKGRYQQGFTLANGGELHISTGQYTPGNGVSLVGVGLTPDYTVQGENAQRDKAYAVLLEEMEGR